jgi:hypothetical protein
MKHVGTLLNLYSCTRREGREREREREGKKGKKNEKVSSSSPERDKGNEEGKKEMHR